MHFRLQVWRLPTILLPLVALHQRPPDVDARDLALSYVQSCRHPISRRRDIQANWLPRQPAPPWRLCARQQKAHQRLQEVPWKQLRTMWKNYVLTRLHTVVSETATRRLWRYREVCFPIREPISPANSPMTRCPAGSSTSCDPAMRDAMWTDFEISTHLS